MYQVLTIIVVDMNGRLLAILACVVGLRGVCRPGMLVVAGDMKKMVAGAQPERASSYEICSIEAAFTCPRCVIVAECEC